MAIDKRHEYWPVSVLYQNPPIEVRTFDGFIEWYKREAVSLLRWDGKSDMHPSIALDIILTSQPHINNNAIVDDAKYYVHEDYTKHGDKLTRDQAVELVKIVRTIDARFTEQWNEAKRILRQVVNK